MTSGACVPTCGGGGGDGQKSVWGIALDFLSDIQLLLNIYGPYGQTHGVQVVWSAPPWSWMLWKTSPPHDKKGTVSFWYNRNQQVSTKPWVKIVALTDMA